MAVRGHFGGQERMRRLAAGFTQGEVIAKMQWRAALQVRQLEGADAIPAIGGAEERE